jgi:ribosome-associated protein
LTKALHKPKKRKPTKISKAVKAARLDNKRIQADKKKSRKKEFGD